MIIAIFIYMLYFETIPCGANDFKILGHLYCGNQDVTGILEIVQDGVLYSSCQVSRNVVNIEGNLKLKPSGIFSMTLRTPCGVISRLGTCCDHLFELDAGHIQGTLFPIFINPIKPINITEKGKKAEAEDLLGRIKDGQAKLVCTDTDSSACLPYCNMPEMVDHEDCVRWDITKDKCGCLECEKQCEAAKQISCRNG